MAGAVEELNQQKSALEGRIRLLVNNDLKEICKANGQQVSGTKIILQRRVFGLLDDICNNGDVASFEALKYRVSNHGARPPPNHTLGGSSGGMGYGTSSMAPKSMPKAPSSGTPEVHFKPSPFYTIVENITRPQDLPGGPEMPQNRHTVTAYIKLSDEQIRRLKDNRSMRVMIYCGQHVPGITQYTALDVAFPNQIEVKVNSDEVKANFKGLKNKPGTTKPADITDKLRKTSGYANPLTLCYALTTKRFHFVVQLVEHMSWDELVRKPHRVIQKQTVIDEMNKANADPDIAATSVKMSLKDPVSTMRITVPVRSTVCSHNQCFDLAMFMQLQEQAPTWSCPICSRHASFESLCVDKYFQEILSITAKDVEQVTIEPNGEWSVDKDDEDKGKSNQAKGEARAAYDDDFDDDLVEVMDPPPKEPNGFKREFPSATTAISTPPLSVASREPSIMSNQRPASGNKRPANAVIDLTLSDDDEPPRPAKRQTTGNAVQQTNSYNTPLSIPDPPRFQAYTQQPAEGAVSSFRQSSIGRSPVAPPAARSSFAVADHQQSPGLLSPFHPGAQSLPPMRTSHSPAQNHNFQHHFFANLNNDSGFRHATMDDHPSAFEPPPSSQNTGLRLPLGRPQQQHQDFGHQQPYGQENHGQEDWGNWRSGDFDYGQHNSSS